MGMLYARRRLSQVDNNSVPSNTNGGTDKPTEDKKKKADKKAKTDKE